MRFASQEDTLPYVVAALVWLAAAIIVGAAGVTQRLQPPAPQLVLASLTALLILSGQFLGGFRAWLAGLGWRPLVALHLARFVGLYFLILYSRGELPFAFAVPGGIGDVAVAALALALLISHRLVSGRPALLFTWNVVGLLDILFVVVTAARLGWAQPGSMAALLRLPLSLLPTFLVPLIIASHVWIFAELRRGTPSR